MTILLLGTDNLIWISSFFISVQLLSRPIRTDALHPTVVFEVALLLAMCNVILYIFRFMRRHFYPQRNRFATFKLLFRMQNHKPIFQYKK